MSEQVIFVDTRTINTLLSANGTSGLNTLLASGQRVMVSQNVLLELQSGPQSLYAKFDDWYVATSAGNGQVFTPSFLLPPGPQAGDDSLRAIALAYKDTYLARFLSDDAGIYLNEKNATSNFGLGGLTSRGQYARPFFGTGEYLTELLFDGKLTQSEYNSVVGDIRNSSTWNTIPSASDRDFKYFFGKCILDIPRTLTYIQVR